jgi:transposase
MLARDRVIAQLLAGGASPTAIARELGFSRNAIYDMQRRAQEADRE